MARIPEIIVAGLRMTLAMLLAGTLVPAVSVGQGVANLSFDEGNVVEAVSRPPGWSANAPVHELALDTADAVAGRASLRSRYILDGARPPGDFAVAVQAYPIELARGRALKLIGWMRTEDVTEGFAGLWMRVDGPSGITLEFDNMESRGIRGTTPWTRYTVQLPVDSGAVQVVFGAIHPGTGTAWFDSLSVEVVGPARPRATGAYTAPPRPAEDLTRLLTDRELAVVPDPDAPPEDSAWTEWVRGNAHPIRSLGADDFSDLAFLAPLLEGKRIVQLGENGHGVREFILAKVRLIRYLHEHLGYDVIAFESSLNECDRAGRAPNAVPDAVTLMRNCIFSVWHTEEVVQLFEYIRETEGTSRPLRLTGFDVQISSHIAGARSGFLRDVVAAIDTAYARSVFDTDRMVQTELMRTLQDVDDSLPEAEWGAIFAFYEGLADWLSTNETAIAAKLSNGRSVPRLARQTAISMAVFVRQVLAGRSPESIEVRDRGMADNLDFLADVLYPDQKIIVWAHNFHVQRRGYGYGWTPDVQFRTMGSFVADRRRRDLYTIGLYMYRGTAARNDRRVYPITAHKGGSLESILHRSPWRYSFVDMSSVEREPGTSWMYEPIVAKEWGTNPQQIIPLDEYDGILFIDTTWPPEYLR
ncbi:MAG: hypothetical protein GEU90_09315 [Gemmatimonas sp.]|nr:hypothetical protein [Gemmatimonas sp.]